MKIAKIFSMGAALAALALFPAINSHAALIAGATYTVRIEKVNTDGTVTSGATSLGVSTTATADADGKLSFSLNNVPNNDTCNFMVTSIEDGDGVTQRKSIAPCPDASSTMPLGVSGMTTSQATALLAGFAAAGSDDPILAVFGNTVVRSTGIPVGELAEIATICMHGINDAGGFVATLTDNGVTASQLAIYRSAIIAQLADANAGYSKIMKESVDDGFSVSDEEARKKQGEAAALLMNVLVQAATTAGFDQALVLQAFNGMGDVVMPLFQAAQAASDISAGTMQTVNSTVGGAINKLRVDKELATYTEALTALGATGDDVTQFTDAATAMTTAMRAAFETFDTVFTGTETEAQVAAAQTTLNTAMNAAYTAFMTAVAADGPRLTTLVTALNTTLGGSYVTAADFTTYTEAGEVNWPIMNVVLATWINSAVVANGYDLASTVAYTRDTVAIPAAITWLGTCSDNGYHDKTSCEAASETWTAGRTDYAGLGIPGSFAAMFAIQEDIMIREFIRYDAQAAAGDDLGDQQLMEKAYNDALDTIAGNISGTNPALAAITTAQKKAIVRLMKSPQF